MSNNELTELPSDIDKLVNLEVLVLSTNQLKKLPSQIGSLRKLRELDLEENELECIPSDIGMLRIKLSNKSNSNIKQKYFAEAHVTVSRYIFG